MIQTVTTAQELYLKACLVDRAKLRDAQARQNIVDAEECLRHAFGADVKPVLMEWRKSKGMDPKPMEAYRASGYEARVAKEREAARAARGASSGSSYA
jgi:L-rhamnose isomerase/sugar isomerase